MDFRSTIPWSGYPTVCFFISRCKVITIMSFPGGASGKVKVKVKSLRRVRLFVTPWTIVHGILQARILEWVCHFLLQEIFPTQGSNPGLPSITAGDVRDVDSIPGLRRSPWRRAWQPALVLLPGESHGQRSLVGYSLQGHKELDTTEHTRMHKHTHTFVTLFAKWGWYV